MTAAWEQETHPVRRRVWEMSRREDGLMWTRRDCEEFPRDHHPCCFGHDFAFCLSGGRAPSRQGELGL